MPKKSITQDVTYFVGWKSRCHTFDLFYVFIIVEWWEILSFWIQLRSWELLPVANAVIVILHEKSLLTNQNHAMGFVFLLGMSWRSFEETWTSTEMIWTPSQNAIPDVFLELRFFWTTKASCYISLSLIKHKLVTKSSWKSCDWINSLNCVYLKLVKTINIYSYLL